MFEQDVNHLIECKLMNYLTRISFAPRWAKTLSRKFSKFLNPDIPRDIQISSDSPYRLSLQNTTGHS